MGLGCHPRQESWGKARVSDVGVSERGLGLGLGLSDEQPAPQWHLDHIESLGAFFLELLSFESRLSISGLHSDGSPKGTSAPKTVSANSRCFKRGVEAVKPPV